MTELLAGVKNFLALGGPVVAILLAMSVLALALVLVKLWQFQRAGVGEHGALIAALDQGRSRGHAGGAAAGRAGAQSSGTACGAGLECHR